MAKTTWKDRWAHGKSFVLQLRTAFIDDRAPLAAAAVAFYLFLSMVPLLLLAISVAAFFISRQQAEAMASNLTLALGSGVGGAAREQLLSIVQYSEQLAGLSLLFGLWTGSQIFVFVQTALNQMWDVEDRRPFWVRRGLALLAVLVTGVLALLAVGMVYLLRLLSALNIPLLGTEVGDVPWVIPFLFNFLLPTLIIAIAFALIYRYLSARTVPWGLVWPGALVAAVLWGIVLQLFSWYTGNFANYAVLYGSLGGLVILLLWFNYSALVMLLGAEIAAVMHYRRVEAGKAKERWGDDLEDENQQDQAA